VCPSELCPVSLVHSHPQHPATLVTPPLHTPAQLRQAANSRRMTTLDHCTEDLRHGGTPLGKTCLVHWGGAHFGSGWRKREWFPVSVEAVGRGLRGSHDRTLLLRGEGASGKRHSALKGHVARAFRGARVVRGPWTHPPNNLHPSFPPARLHKFGCHHSPIMQTIYNPCLSSSYLGFRGR
jgi:hypothetical protein